MEFRSKHNRYGQTSYVDVVKWARAIYKPMADKTKRQPYVRSAYFDNQKILLATFWLHIKPKNSTDKARRLRFYLAAIDLIAHTKIGPELKKSTGATTAYYRFFGRTKDGHPFVVQIKENTKTGRKDLISIFPASKKDFWPICGSKAHGRKVFNGILARPSIVSIKKILRQVM